MVFVLANWNINSVRLRIALVEELLQAHQPDVLCLQEIKCQNDQFPWKNFQKLGYEHKAVLGQKGYHGVAIVSKRPIVASHSIDFCNMGDSRHIAADIHISGKLVRIHNFYVPAGGDEPDVAINPKFDHKLRFLEEMKRIHADNGGMDNILVGDLNIAPHENDVWSHKQLLKVVSHTPIETEMLDLIRDQGGWIDLVRQKFPLNQKLYTWWSYRARDWAEADRGRRLDHIWSSPALAPSLQNIEILREARGWEKASDHVPLLAQFDLT